MAILMGTHDITMLFFPRRYGINKVNLIFTNGNGKDLIKSNNALLYLKICFFAFENNKGMVQPFHCCKLSRLYNT